jgi:hypothetical protein
MSPFRVGCGAVVLTIIALWIIGALTRQAPTGPPSDAGLRQAPSTAAPARPARGSPTIVLSETGSGSQTTRKFPVSDDWDLRWAYNCDNIGMASNFQVYIDGGSGEIGPNELAMKGDGTDHLHGGSGYRYLTINSGCNWTIEAVSL